MKIRKTFLSLLVVALAVTGLATTTNIERAAHAKLISAEPAQEIERISVDELKSMMEQSTPVVIIDVRSASAFNTSHIRGAINVPIDQVGAHIAQVPTDREIVTYCA